MLAFLLVFVSLSSLLSVLASPTNYTLQHRFIPASQHSQPLPIWQHYGTISLDLEGTPAGHFTVGDNREGVRDDGLGMYQLGLEVDGEMLLTSTKSCYIAAPQVYTFVLHLPDARSQPRSMDLKLTYVEANGACPRRWHEPGDMLFLPNGIATAVEVRLPNKIEGPSLAPPPTVDATTGKAKLPEPEKTFFQKYWLAILGVGFFAMTLMGPQDDRRGGAGAGGGGAPAR